jgi:tetratricopeptide (TPR) repeat protein
LQGEVARAVTSKVGVTVKPQAGASAERVRSVDPEAHRLFLLGRFHANKATVEGLNTGIQYFERAIASDPVDARVHASLAEAYIGLGWFGPFSPREVMPKAKAAATEAVKLDESLAEGHAALGTVHLFYDWNGPAAERELHRAIELSPNLPSARLSYAGYLLTANRQEESVAQIRAAVELDPLSLRTHALATLFLIFARRYDEAIEQARRGRELDPKYGLIVALQGLAYTEQRRFQEAIGNLERATELDRNPTVLSFGAHVHAVAGRKSKARELIREAESVAARQYFCPYEIATTYVSLGDVDTAVKWFRKGIEERADCMAWLAVEPWIEPFRSDPRYAELLREIGLGPGAR